MASMAEGPALKLFHSILTLGPIAFSNQPLALPTIACGCVMLGNAPTRMTVWLNPWEAANKRKVTIISALIFIPIPAPAFHAQLSAKPLWDVPWVCGATWRREAWSP